MPDARPPEEDDDGRSDAPLGRHVWTVSNPPPPGWYTEEVYLALLFARTVPAGVLAQDHLLFLILGFHLSEERLFHEIHAISMN